MEMPPVARIVASNGLSNHRPSNKVSCHLEVLKMFSKIPAVTWRFSNIPAKVPKFRKVQQKSKMFSKVQQSLAKFSKVQQSSAKCSKVQQKSKRHFSKTPGWLASEARCELVKSLHSKYSGRRVNIEAYMPM
jgi:hypothetical protein